MTSDYIASVRRWHNITQRAAGAAMEPPVSGDRVTQIETNYKTGPRSRKRLMDAINKILQERQ